MPLTTKNRLAKPTKSSKPITPIRDAAKTRARILKVAIGEFSSKGYSGARTDEIARRARTNIRMLYHYFGSKDGLYLNVLEDVLSELRHEELQLGFDAATPLDGLLQMFEFIDGHFRTRPELRSLLAYENLNHAQHLKRSATVRQMASPVIELIDRLLRRGEQTKTLRVGVDALHLYVAMVSLSYYSLSHAPTLSRIFDIDLSAPSWQRAQHNQSVQMLMSYLTGTSVSEVA